MIEIINCTQEYTIKRCMKYKTTKIHWKIIKVKLGKIRLIIFMDRKVIIIKIPTFPILVYKFNEFSIEISEEFFYFYFLRNWTSWFYIYMEIQKEQKWLRWSKRGVSIRELVLPAMKIYFKAVLIMTMTYCCRNSWKD